MKLGINSMGRIGKLALWHQVARKHFDEVVVNVGRPVGRNLNDLLHAVESDSTYGNLGKFLHGYNAGRIIEQADEAKGTAVINGLPVRFLRNARNPKDIGWRDHGVRLVVDCTGAFIDPTASADEKNGSLRGHLAAGAEKAVLSAPFKIKNKQLSMPEDAVTTVMGINDDVFDPGRHVLISCASCTTTCLSFMVKPLVDHFGADRILSASMVTIHASTGSQKVLDAIPKAAATDLRKTRSVMNNIILTTTGAAKALRLVIPEMGEIGFMAESVRIPSTTGSLVILTVNLQSEDAANPINRNDINGILKEAAEGAFSKYMVFSEKQNVSSDIIGFPRAATVIESQETHTRTAFTRVNLGRVPGLPEKIQKELAGTTLDVPVTQAVIYGWYDNELGSYAHMLTENLIHMSEKMV
ncbi:MAG: glyceraldehyde-3-phosphate dehydrogenase [Magnetococcales bacterium]|nr:glyceraldehyde-3-phosphate dehydrogenase [Magnetococcales bacterium]